MDIRLNISWYTSLKRKALIRRLGHRGVTAIIDLWLYVAQHKPDGNLTGLTDEDIAEAAQFDGDFSEFIKAIGPKPDGLGFLDGDSTQRKVHDWKEHNPWAANAKARSRAAKRAVEERWRKEREIRDEYDPYTDSIQTVDKPHIPLSSSSSSSSPIPSPNHEIPPAGGDATKKRLDGRDNTPVGRWCRLHQELWGERFVVTPVVAKHIKDAGKALGDDIEEFDRRVRIFLEDTWVKENRPGPDHFYRNINKYAKKAEKAVFRHNYE